MLVPFQQLPSYSRVWVFQSTKCITAQQKESLETMMSGFCEAWQSHGKELVAGFKIEWEHFLIVGVNENSKDASGCSIDKLFHLLSQWQTAQDLDFFDRKFVALVDQESLNFASIQEVKSIYKQGKIPDNQLIINTLTNTKALFESSFTQAISKSWIGVGLSKAMV